MFYPRGSCFSVAIMKFIYLYNNLPKYKIISKQYKCHFFHFTVGGEWLRNIRFPNMKKDGKQNAYIYFIEIKIVRSAVIWWLRTEAIGLKCKPFSIEIRARKIKLYLIRSLGGILNRLIYIFLKMYCLSLLRQRSRSLFSPAQDTKTLLFVLLLWFLCCCLCIHQWLFWNAIILSKHSGHSLTQN